MSTRWQQSEAKYKAVKSNNLNKEKFKNYSRNYLTKTV